MQNFISIKHAGDLIEHHRQSIYDLAYRNKIPTEKLERPHRTYWMIPTEQFLKWVDEEIVRHEERIRVLKRASIKLRGYIAYGN